MSESAAGGQVHDAAPEPVPPWLLAAAQRIGLTEADLVAMREEPMPAGMEPPPDHSEEMLLRFLAPALGAAFDAGRIDADRVAIYVVETMAFPAAVVAAAVEVSLDAAPTIPLEDLGEALADLLDDLDEAHDRALLDAMAAPAGADDLGPTVPELLAMLSTAACSVDPDAHRAPAHDESPDAPPAPSSAAAAPTPTAPTPTAPTPASRRRAKPGLRLPPRVLARPVRRPGHGSPSVTSSSSSWRGPRRPNPPSRADPTRRPGLSSPRPPARAPPARLALGLVTATRTANVAQRHSPPGAIGHVPDTRSDPAAGTEPLGTRAT